MATQDPTTNYSWDLPTVDGSDGTWGTELNSIIGDDSTGIDAVVKAVSDVANAALPKAGGTMTGNLVSKTQSHTLVNLGNMSGTVDFDLSTGNVFYGTLTGNVTTITFSNAPAGGVFFTLEITNGGAFSITWPAAVKWPGGTAPTLTSLDLLVFYTRSAGTTVRGALAMGNSQ